MFPSIGCEWLRGEPLFHWKGGRPGNQGPSSGLPAVGDLMRLERMSLAFLYQSGWEGPTALAQGAKRAAIRRLGGDRQRTGRRGGWGETQPSPSDDAALPRRLAGLIGALSDLIGSVALLLAVVFPLRRGAAIGHGILKLAQAVVIAAVRKDDIRLSQIPRTLQTVEELPSPTPPRRLESRPRKRSRS